MRRVLVVDDEPHVIRVMKLSLERAGYHVDTCPNGEAAAAYLEQQHPDVMVTDIQMPRMTGEQLCKLISERYPQREFLIFILTSRTEIEHRDWSRDISNAMFMEKPVSTRKLITMIDNYFEGKKVSSS